jgi:2-dehydropantoate 2-reductase
MMRRTDVKGASMHVAVIGAGGVGGFFGARLQSAGHAVTFLARGAHLDAIRTRGLTIENVSSGATETVPVRAVDRPADIGVADVVLFAVKMADTEGAAAAMAPIVGPRTAILSLQNGVIKDDLLRARFPPENVLGGVAYIAAAISRPGVIAQTGTMQRVVVGEYDGRRSERVEALVDAWVRTGVDATLSTDIRRVLWEKYVFLTGISALTTATRLPVGAVRSAPASRALLEAVIAEAVAVGRAHGVDLPADYAADRMAFIDGLPAPMKASMLHDLEAGKPLELDWLSGGIVSLGAAVGVPTPANAAIVGVLAPWAAGANAELGAAA